MKRLLATLLGLSLLTVAPPPAEACINGVMRQRVPSIKDLQNAEDLIAQGQYKKALRLLKRGNLRRVPRRLGARGSKVRNLIQRRSRLYAAIAIHTGGKYRLDGSCCSRTKASRRGNLKAALRMLPKQKKGKADPINDSLRAEALAAMPGGKVKAAAILEDLAKRDLIPTAQAWLTLAKLRKDPAARKDALTRCKRASRDGRMCSLR